MKKRFLQLGALKGGGIKLRYIDLLLLLLHFIVSYIHIPLLDVQLHQLMIRYETNNLNAHLNASQRNDYGKRKRGERSLMIPR